MTIAENVDPKRSSSDLSNAIDEIVDRRPMSENAQDVHRSDDATNSSTEGNPLLETDRRSASVKIDSTIGRSKKVDKDEDDRTSMNNPRKDVEANDQNIVTPPDGGLRAWMVMIGSFVINGVLFSVINTYSLIYLELQKRLLESGETAASSKAGESCCSS